jgi:P4 family phage/plasmid primase-like protien
MIPKQLENWQFILLLPSRKIPIGEMNGWAKDRANKTYTYNDSVLLDHLTKNGNYGVCSDKDRFIIGCDTKEVELAIEQRLPKTFTVRTPRHKTKHFYYYGEIKSNIQTKPTAEGDPCADIKHGNAYVLGPNSTFEGFGKYEVVDDLPIATITEEELTSAINEFIISKKVEIEPTETQIKNPETNFPITKLLTDINGMSQNGTDLSGPHPKHGSTTGSNFHVDTAKNVWHCFRHNSGGGPLELLSVLEGIINCEDALKGALRGEKFIKVVTKAVEKGYLAEMPHFTDQGEFKKVVVSKNGIAHTEPDMEKILEYFEEKYIFKTSADTEDIYVYNKGFYELAEVQLKAEVETILGSTTNTHLVNEILDHIRRRSYTERNEFNRYGDVLPCKNGLLNLTSLELEPFSPDKIFTFKINAEYHKGTDCPKFKKFVAEILNEENAKLIQEYMGYCLLPAMPFHKIAFLYGVGRNGKDRIVLTLQALLGIDHCEHVTLEELNGEYRFAPVRLYGKLANFSTEPISKQALNTSLIKKITGQSWIDGEVKNKQNPIKFMNIAKLWVLGNKFPKIEDMTLAFWDRLLLIMFEATFTGNEKILDIEKRWTQDADEMSGLLNWMLEGLTRLWINNSFTETDAMKDLEIRFKRISDPITAFLSEPKIIAIEKDAFTTRDEVYTRYKEYCEDIDELPEPAKALYAKIRQMPRVNEAQPKKDRGFKGLKLLPKPKVEPPPPINHTLPIPSTVTTVTAGIEKSELGGILQPSKECLTPVVSVASVEEKPETPFAKAQLREPVTDLLGEECPYCLEPVLADHTDATIVNEVWWHIVCARKLEDGRNQGEE